MDELAHGKNEPTRFRKKNLDDPRLLAVSKPP